jgi:hypothetical protein
MTTTSVLPLKALLGICFFQFAAIMLGAITFGIAYIWVVPLVIILYGQTYLNIQQKSA